MSDLLYGVNPVTEALNARRREVSAVYTGEGTQNNPRIRKIVSMAQYRGIPVKTLSRALLTEMAGSRENQGILIECGAFPYTPFADMLGAPRMVLLDNIEDPHNIGAVMRTAEVLGWKNVLLPRRGTALVLPSVAKTSAGACEYLNIAVNCSANQYIKIAKEEGYCIVSLDGEGTSTFEGIRSEHPGKLLLVVGGEDAGVGQFIKMNSTHICAIPQQGHVNSLNASVAAALALFELAIR